MDGGLLLIALRPHLAHPRNTRYLDLVRAKPDSSSIISQTNNHDWLVIPVDFLTSFCFYRRTCAEDWDGTGSRTKTGRPGYDKKLATQWPIDAARCIQWSYTDALKATKSVYVLHEHLYHIHGMHNWRKPPLCTWGYRHRLLFNVTHRYVANH